MVGAGGRGADAGRRSVTDRGIHLDPNEIPGRGKGSIRHTNGAALDLTRARDDVALRPGAAPAEREREEGDPHGGRDGSTHGGGLVVLPNPEPSLVSKESVGNPPRGLLAERPGGVGSPLGLG